MARKVKYIVVNDRRVYIEIRRGTLHLAPEALSEQCDGCGKDIIEWGTLHRDTVVCNDCGSTFVIQEGR